MSEETSKMEVDSPPATDIAALKEVAKEKLEKCESEAKSDNTSDNDKNGDSVVTNGDSNGSTGNGDSHDSEEDGEEAEVEAPGDGEQSENGGKSPSKEDEEVETITSSPMKTTPKKGDNPDPDVSPRRSGRKKTPTKYQELLEAEKESSEEEIEEVEEIKDDDSDIQEVEADESPLTAGGSVTITPKNSAAQKKPNVVTIDDLKTLQKLATTAKASMDREKSDRASAMDTQSIIAGKMGSGVSITPAKPKTPASSSTSSSSTASSISNMSPAGLTLGSGVTIRPNKPATASSSSGTSNGVSIVPVDKSASHSTNSSGGSGSSTVTSSGVNKAAEVDPNLTDDTYVVEAPSFIVPYVYEKPPKEEIKLFKESIDKIVEDKKKEKEKKRAAGEEVSDDEEDKKKKKKEEEGAADSDSADEEEKKEKERKEAEAKAKLEKDKKDNKDNYFGSTLGKYFIDLGMNLVQEFVQKDLLREQQRRSVKDKSVAVIHAIKSLEHNLEESKEKNEGFHFGLRKCKFCSFRTESRLVLENHMETPHMRNFIYRCNFCDYETKIPQEVLFHMDSEHGIKGKLERAPYYHQCPQCPFEDNSKGKLTRHKVGCDKRFKAEENQKPDRDWDPPAKIRPPPVRPGSFTGYMNYQQKGAAGPGRAPGSSLMQRPQLAPKPGLNRIPIGRASSMNKNQMGMRGMTPQMLASQQMLAVLNQQGLSVSGVKGLNSMMLGNNQGKSGSVTIQVSVSLLTYHRVFCQRCID